MTAVPIAVVALAGCGGAGPASAPADSASPLLSRTPGVTPEVTVDAQPGQDAAAPVYARLTPAQRIGQLFMVGVTTPGMTAEQVRAIRQLKLGNVFLDGHGRTTRGRVAQTTRRARGLATYAGVAPLVATDQEGGEVQSLRGRGFSRMPDALDQGRGKNRPLEQLATRWARELRTAGVNLDLAPVADVVPRWLGRRNPPIGRYRRELGHRPDAVADLVRQLVTGMKHGGVGATLKHFPGLGRARANTDAATRVTDPTTRHDPRLAPFDAGIRAGADAVMVSSARYPALDGKQACFSPLVMRTMLRGDLHFFGIVMSDSMNTPAVRRLPPGKRAVWFLAAGGTMVLDVDAADLPAMVHAVRARARHDRAFARLVRQAVLTVLRVKMDRGLAT